MRHAFNRIARNLVWCIAASMPWRVVPAHAAEPTTLEQQPSQRVQPKRFRFNLGVRGFMMPGAGLVGGFGLGLDASYSVMPNLAVGVTANSFLIDQGADPQYCSRCVTSGNSEQLFAEGRLWPLLVFTPYARLGMGHAHLEGQEVSSIPYAENRFAVSGELGAELHYAYLSVRTFGFHLRALGSPLDESAFFGIGVQLGARM